MMITKRTGNVVKILPDGYEAPAWGDGWPNVWLGCTVVNQLGADRDIPKLLAVPAKVRFLSIEPLLGPVDLHTELCREIGSGSVCAVCLGGLGLVIVSGESGPGARPMHPAWARVLRDRCALAGAAFHFKQWGAWAHEETVEDGASGLDPPPHWQGRCRPPP